MRSRNWRSGRNISFRACLPAVCCAARWSTPRCAPPLRSQLPPWKPVYPQTEGLSSTVIARCIQQLLPHAELLADPLPAEMRRKYRLPDKADAVRAIHCPASPEQATAARRRLIYEELLVLQLGIGCMKSRGAADTGAPMRLIDPAPFWESLPFAPTGAQRRAVTEILADMSGQHAMNRLLQGDVGSGKTLVAAAAIWACIRSGYQAALLAPTEILATQHAESLNRMLAPFGMRVALLTGGMKAAARAPPWLPFGTTKRTVWSAPMPSWGAEWNLPAWAWLLLTNSTALAYGSGVCWPKRRSTPTCW